MNHANRADLERDYRAAMAGAGTAPLDRWTTVRVAGGDRASFLHNMCTNDVKGLTRGAMCEAFFTDVKGKIVAHAFLLAGAEATQLVTVPNQAERLITHLDRYIIREDVQLADQSADVAWRVAFGASANEIVAALGPAVERFEWPWRGQWLVGTRNAEAATWAQSLHAGGVVSGGEELFNAIRIEAGWPLFGVDFDGSHLPQEVGRDALAIHFRKGCYLGQETVARIDALGHVNRRIVPLRFEGDAVPAIGAELTQGDQAAGRVTSACWSPRLGAPLGLAMVRRGANEAGTRLACGGVPCEVVAPT